MAEKRDSLLVLSIAVFVLLALVTVSPERESLAAASRDGRNSLELERNLRDALMAGPPFSETAQEVTAPAAPAPANTRAALPPPEYVPHGDTAPVQPQPTYIPAPPSQPGMPEVMVRGYSVDPNGTITTIGMDGVLRTIDGSRPVKLTFPPEYGLPPQIVGGSRFVAPQPLAGLPTEIAVRGYSVDPSGAITIVGMDGVVRTIDGSRPVKLVFPPPSMGFHPR